MLADVAQQQGHAADVNAVAYSPNGQLVATGGDDGKVKIWNASSGFCFVTFAEHAAPVTGLAFMGGRGTANLLTRATAILATAFFVLSLLMAVLDRGAVQRRSILDVPAPAAAPAAPSIPAPATN